jgi:cytochrome c553
MGLRKRSLLVIAMFSSAAGTSSGLAQETPARLPDTIEQRLVACAICHGDKGEGKGAAEYYPRLSGKPARYLFLQLVNFREGKRKYPQMVYLVRYMPDAYLQEIADYYAKLQVPYLPPAPPTSNPHERERGRALVTTGDPARHIPACVSCHGKALTGMLPAIPGLVGLPADYIAGQLGAWKTNARVAHAPDCMHEIAQRLSGADMSAVAKWIASQPALPNTPPVAQGTTKLPLACGSQTF